MAIHTHLLNQLDHSEFLLEGRRDLVTSEVFRVGETVVVCANCHTIYTLDSWEYLSSVCRNNNCGCRETLDHLPLQTKVYFRPPTIESFNATSKNVFPGERIEFSWQVKDYDSIYLGFIEVTNLNAYEIEIEEESVFQLNAINSKGNTIKELVLNLLPPVIHNFSASSNTIIENKSIRLTWYVSGGTELLIRNHLDEEIIVKDNFLDVQPEIDTIYTLYAKNRIGEMAAKVKLQTLPITILAFKVDKKRVKQGDFVRITWEVENAKNVFLNNGIGQVSKKGEREIQAGNEDVNIILTAEGIYNTSKELQTFVEVAAINNIATEQIGNDQYRLLWNANYFYQSYIIDENQQVIKGKKLPSGQFFIYIPRQTTNTYFTIVGAMEDGSTIEIRKLFKVPKIKFFEANSSIVYPNMSLELNWEIEDVNLVEISQDIGSVFSTGKMSLMVNNGVDRFKIMAFGEVGYEEKEIILKYFEVPTLDSVNVKPSVSLYKFKPRERLSILDLSKRLSFIDVNRIRSPNFSIARKDSIISKGITVLKIYHQFKIRNLNFPSITDLFLKIKKTAIDAT